MLQKFLAEGADLSALETDVYSALYSSFNRYYEDGDFISKQYISFIDPKGLMHIRADDPKVEFYKTIKELEARLAPTAKGKTVILNSFIMSGTKSSDLRSWWSTPEVDADCAYREARNVYTLDNTECVELMINKILQ